MKFINKIFSRLQVQNQLEKENCTNLLHEYCRYRPGHTLQKVETKEMVAEVIIISDWTVFIMKQMHLWSKQLILMKFSLVILVFSHHY